MNSIVHTVLVMLIIAVCYYFGKYRGRIEGSEDTLWYLDSIGKIDLKKMGKEIDDDDNEW